MVTAEKKAQQIAHTKQSLQKIRRGVPKINEMQEGVPVVSVVPGDGVYSFIKIKNKIYKMAWTVV